MDTTIESYLTEDISNTTSRQGLLDGALPSADIIQGFLILSTVLGILFTIAFILYALRTWAVQRATLNMQKDIADIKKILSESHTPTGDRRTAVGGTASSSDSVE